MNDFVDKQVDGQGNVVTPGTIINADVFNNRVVRADGSAVQTITGKKTFNDSPIVPDAAENNQAVNKGQLDAKITVLNDVTEWDSGEEFRGVVMLFPLTAGMVRFRASPTAAWINVSSVARHIMIASRGGGYMFNVFGTTSAQANYASANDRMIVDIQSNGRMQLVVMGK